MMRGPYDRRKCMRTAFLGAVEGSAVALRALAAAGASPDLRFV